jgi:hypothetical protein
MGYGAAWRGEQRHAETTRCLLRPVWPGLVQAGSPRSGSSKRERSDATAHSCSRPEGGVRIEACDGRGLPAPGDGDALLLRRQSRERETSASTPGPSGGEASFRRRRVHDTTQASWKQPPDVRRLYGMAPLTGRQPSAPGRPSPVNFEASSSMSSDTVLPIGWRRALENRSDSS